MNYEVEVLDDHEELVGTISCEGDSPIILGDIQAVRQAIASMVVALYELEERSKH